MDINVEEDDYAKNSILLLNKRYWTTTGSYKKRILWLTNDAPWYLPYPKMVYFSQPFAPLISQRPMDNINQYYLRIKLVDRSDT